MNEIKVMIPRNEVVLIDSGGNPLYVPPLEENEKLVDVGKYNDFIKPIYDEKSCDFIESATPEEIAAARPTLTQKTITEEEKATDLLKIIALNIMNNDELLKTFGIEPRPTA